MTYSSGASFSLVLSLVKMESPSAYSWSGFFAQCYACETHPRGTWAVLSHRCVTAPRCEYSTMSWLIVWLFLVRGHQERSCWGHSCTGLCADTRFHFSWLIPGSGVTGKSRMHVCALVASAQQYSTVVVPVGTPASVQ